MADVVNLTLEHSRSDDLKGKGGIASAADKVVSLLDDDDDEKTRTLCVMKEAYSILPQRGEFCCPEGWTLKNSEPVLPCISKHHGSIVFWD